MGCERVFHGGSWAYICGSVFVHSIRYVWRFNEWIYHDEYLLLTPVVSEFDILSVSPDSSSAVAGMFPAFGVPATKRGN